MAGKPQYIRDEKTGKLAGSIGAGKGAAPVAPQSAPALLHKLQETAAKSRHPSSAGTPGVDYDPVHEAAKLIEAMSPAKGLTGRRRQAKLRNELEGRFGPIDWSDTRVLA